MFFQQLWLAGLLFVHLLIFLLFILIFLLLILIFFILVLLWTFLLLFLVLFWTLILVFLLLGLLLVLFLILLLLGLLKPLLLLPANLGWWKSHLPLLDLWHFLFIICTELLLIPRQWSCLHLLRQFPSGHRECLDPPSSSWLVESGLCILLLPHIGNGPCLGRWSSVFNCPLPSFLFEVSHSCTSNLLICFLARWELGSNFGCCFGLLPLFLHLLDLVLLDLDGVHQLLPSWTVLW